METRLILQGFTTETHLNALQLLLGQPGIQRAILSVAYLNRGGVDLIADLLTALNGQVRVFAGIRNGVTSKQGLARLLECGVEVFAVDTGARSVLFHPKLYFSRAAAAARLLIGSANLTVGGLNNNIEAGVVIDLNLTAPTDNAFRNDVEARFDGLAREYPQNMIAVFDAAQIDTLHDEGRLEDEQARPTSGQTAATTPPPQGMVPRIRLAVPTLRRPLIPAQTAVAPAQLRPRPIATAWQPIWESKPLTERDLTIPTGATTHATGSINLDKGLLPPSTDHRHYFRETVFNALTWLPGNWPEVEEANTRFQLVVQGVNHGEFDLTIAHSMSTTNTSYQQRNAMTRLRWGQVRQYVAYKRLLGCSLTLSRDTADPTRFLIEID